MNKKTRIDYLKEQLISVYNYGIKHNIYAKYGDAFIDPHFYNYKKLGFEFEFESFELNFENFFDFFIESDPTRNKEYTSWLISLYKNILKKYVQYKSEENNETLTAMAEINLKWSTFFEDVHSKVFDSLIRFSEFKQINILEVVNRDIRSFKDYSSFVDFIHSFKLVEEDHDGVLTLRELNCLRNFKHKNLESGIAELVFENKDYLIVITHDEQSNIIFGDKSTWCTAWTSPRNQFKRYHGSGELFVLIRKQKLLNKQDRLQFHFEDSMFMDLADKPINITDFFAKNHEIKQFFKSYILNKVLPKRINKDFRSTVDYLKKFLFHEQIFDMFIESNVEVVDFTEWEFTRENLEKLGNLTNLTELNISSCNLEYLPESLGNLKRLKKFICRNNPKLKTLPVSFGKLENLEIVDLFCCDIRKMPDIDSNTKITEFILDGNANLKKLPKNINKLTKLKRITASCCNLAKIDNDIMGCVNLMILDVHDNENLTQIPTDITVLPNLIALCIDNTNISKDSLDVMKQNKNNMVTIIKYDQQNLQTNLVI